MILAGSMRSDLIALRASSLPQELSILLLYLPNSDLTASFNLTDASSPPQTMVAMIKPY